MRSTFGFVLVPLAAALVGGTLVPAQAGAPDTPSPQRCEQAVARAAGSFFIQHTGVVRRCEKRRAQGLVAPDVDCTADEPMAGEIALLAAELERSVGKACGGADGSCGTSDDVSLADTGWRDVSACPDIDGSGCTNAITDCGDVAECVQCVGESASEQTRGVVADEFEDVEFGTDSDANKCQVALVRGSTKFMQIATKALGRCWAARLQGKGDGDCPGDGKTADILDYAEKKKLQYICEKCGGDDEECGGDDDVTPEAIGFASDCPDLSVPSGSDCGGAILDLEDVVDCVDCVAAFKAECVTRLAAPGAADYPSSCNPSNGGLCGNGVRDPGEECDPAASSTDGAFDNGSPGGAFCPEGETCTSACVCDDGSSTTTTTLTKTTTTTSTTLKQRKCGNGKLDKYEKCDASAPNGLRRCKEDDGCHALKCECVDDDGTTTTTTLDGSTTTTLAGSTTTTTTLPSDDCGNGTVDPGEPCDPSSPGGAFTCGPKEICLAACECG